MEGGGREGESRVGGIDKSEGKVSGYYEGGA